MYNHATVFKLGSKTHSFVSCGCLSVNSPELFFGLFRVRDRVRVRVRVNSVTEMNMMTEK